jgi:hypothetical protein
VKINDEILHQMKYTLCLIYLDVTSTMSLPNECISMTSTKSSDADVFDPEKLMNHVTSLLLFYPSVSKVTAADRCHHQVEIPPARIFY